MTLFPPAGSLFTLGAGPSNSTVVTPTKASTSDSAAVGNTRPPTTVATVANNPPVQSKHMSMSCQFVLSFLSEFTFTNSTIYISSPVGFLFPSGAELSSTVAAEASLPSETTFTADVSTLTSSSAGTVTSATALVESELQHFILWGISSEPSTSLYLFPCRDLLLPLNLPKVKLGCIFLSRRFPLDIRSWSGKHNDSRSQQFRCCWCDLCITGKK